MTFTRAAAGEMRERIESGSGHGTGRRSG
ncbi:MAG: hypothetical protein ACLU2Y_12995 [Blautia massiliensis (ex Durand et al. 2017)]